MTAQSASHERADTRSPRRTWRSLVLIAIGWLAIYLPLDRVATWTNSLYGEAGWLFCALAIVLALAIERLLFGTPMRRALPALGFVWPRRRALLALLAAATPLVAFLPLFATITGAPLTLRAGWQGIAVGVFLQGGLGEEILWRGYLFRHLREGRSFRHAALLTMAFTVAQHTLLLLTLPLPIALLALVVSLTISFPICMLFELDGGAIWSVALLHFVVQGLVKLFVIGEPYNQVSQLAWLVASATIPLIVLAFRPDRD
jgi:membrane protease YdiL (CAAX protease family)